MTPDRVHAAAAAVRRGADAVQRGAAGARRARFVATVRLSARRGYARVDVEVAPDVALGRRVCVEVAPGTRNCLRIGSGTRIDDDVVIRLSGGRLDIGDRVVVRRGAAFNVSGDLRLAGDNLVSWHSVVHCAGRVDIGRQVTISEMVTITDSSHYWTAPAEHVWHNLRVGEVSIGANTWLCAKATVTRDSRVGSCCLIAANSVVVGDVPDGSFASGVPAGVRPNRLPWAVSAAP